MHPCCLSFFFEFDLGLASTKAVRRLRLWGSQMELLEESEKGPALSLPLFSDSEGPVLDLEARFVPV